MNKFAYVTVLFGESIYLAGALVLGYTLKRTHTPNPIIILVTPDISEKSRHQLKKFYTQIIEIPYIIPSKTIFSSEANERFMNVFTKLQVLSLSSYSKILLLDLDMIVCKNIDHLFLLTPPAACLKHFYVPYGKPIPPNMICKNNKLINTINAGLMLLKPDPSELEKIKTSIIASDQINQFKYPEQDYLSLRYCDKWTSITFNYNYQFGLTSRVKKSHYKFDQIYVIHYSSSYKPWNLLLADYIVTPDEDKFINMHKKYYDLWLDIYEKLNIIR